ncbi:MAG: N-acetylmuramidase family protein [Paramuribaculum sp.]|nr:N-acetylmuramidase family protein [Paramuribaculum sp.]
MKRLPMLSAAVVLIMQAPALPEGENNNEEFENDPVVLAALDAIPVGIMPEDLSLIPGHIKRLTEADYRAVAASLGIEVAAMKAVVDIEAGPSHQGFYAPGQPIINFDLTMFRRIAARRGVNLTPYTRTHQEVFARPNVRTYGSMQGGQQARLRAAWDIDSVVAAEATFWGMFQIGGFNWDKCGAKSLDDFVRRMRRSEREQLDMFAEFIKTSGLARHLRSHNWEAFARGYNGPGYARRGYHTRMASAYTQYKQKEKK